MSAATGSIMANICGVAESHREELTGKLGRSLHCPSGWGSQATPGCLWGDNEEVLRWGREGEGADSFLSLMTLRQSTRWPLWVPALHTAGLRMVTLVVFC